MDKQNKCRRIAESLGWMLGAAAIAGSLSGCAALPPNSFIDPTKVGMFPAEYKEGGVRRVLTPREGPMGRANATEPTADDLVPQYQEYRIAPGDIVRVQIEDFLLQGQPYVNDLEVNPAGYIRMPQLDLIKVVGLTEKELEDELRTRIIQQKILPNPVVQALIGVRRGRTFSILGSIRQAGTYPIPYSDLRILDAIGLAGDMGPGVRTIYVIRRGQERYPAGTTAPQPPPAPREKLVIPPPREDDAGFSGTLFSRFGGGQEATTTSPTAAHPAQRELEEALTPDRAPQRGSDAAGDRRPFAPIVFDPATGDAQEALPPPLPPPAAPQSDFRWDEAPEGDMEQRIIEIDVAGLRGGDPRQNIVVRDRDVIDIPIDTGLFYVMGEVNRPGVFGFNEREVTLKQAIAVVGGFTPLAWPARTEIIRRERGTDKQITIPVNVDAIFAGLEDDVLLRDDDIVNVGTHVIAPFLFVIRNSFRFTYGFGFVYDRNFADKDSYGSKINPQITDQSRRANRGLPF